MRHCVTPLTRVSHRAQQSCDLILPLLYDILNNTDKTSYYDNAHLSYRALHRMIHCGTAPLPFNLCES